MVKVCSYNIRGLNKRVKQSDLHSFLVENDISMAGVLETKVKFKKSASGFKNVHNSWQWTSNYQHHPLGRIWLGWNPIVWNVFVVCSSDQFIHCKATFLDSNEVLFFTFVYASNCSVDRIKL